MRDNIIISSNVTCSPMIELNNCSFGVKLTHSNTVELNVSKQLILTASCLSLALIKTFTINHRNNV